MPPPANQGSRFVVPPGQEPVIARMLKPGAGLGDGWSFVRASIQVDAVEGFYSHRGGASARVVLRASADAPESWHRTESFALAIAAAKSVRSDAAQLFRSVVDAVRAAEADFEWRDTRAEVASELTPSAAAGRAAEPEVDRHLDHTPYIDLGVGIDYRRAYSEALTLRDRFVAYQSDPRYGITGWRGLAIQALDGDPTHIATTDDDRGAYQDQSRYRLTDVAELCPVTMSILEELLDFSQSRTVSFLMVEPGAGIAVHVDGEGPPVIRSLNLALNMPEKCRLVIDANPDGSDNAYTRVAPFRPGSALVLNVAKYHYVVNDSDEPRIHVVARGSLKTPATRLLELARQQNGFTDSASLQDALVVKSRALGGAVSDTGAEVGSSPEDTPSSEPQLLSPFVSTLAAAAGDRLAELTGLAERIRVVRIGPDSDAVADWRGEIEVELPSGRVLPLDFHRNTERRSAWFRSASLTCSYRGKDDPLARAEDAVVLRAMCDRLAALDDPGRQNPAVDAFLSAVEKYQPFLPVKDEDYRIVFTGADHPVGILWFGFGCNQDCRMCWQGRSWPAPPDAVFDRWLAELIDARVGSLIFSGGEPTLHPRLPHWLRVAKAEAVHVTLETNAIRLIEPQFLAGLIDAGLESVVVSLHSAHGEVSDSLTRAPGSFVATVEGIRAALSAGLRVGIHCVVESGNVDGLESHARFVASDLSSARTRISQVSYSFPIAYRDREQYDGAIVPLDVLRPRLSGAAQILKEAGIEVRFLGTSGFPPCAYADPGSLLDSLPEVVSDDMRTDRVFVDACRPCALRERCLGVHKTYVDAFGGRGVEPI